MAAAHSGVAAAVSAPPPPPDFQRPERNFANRMLFHGDNLGFLRGMNSGTINLIATDPPFNKNRDFHSTPDKLGSNVGFPDRWRWDEDIHDDWLIAIQRDEPEVWAVITTAKTVWGDDMGAFLCWLGVRLLECHRVLTDDGSLYLHIDHTAHAWVKCLLDAIFGRRQFRNEIVWCYTGPSNSVKQFQRKHDTLLFYAKSDASPFYRDAVRVPYKMIGIDRNDTEIFTESNEERIEELLRIGKVPTDWWADPHLTNISAWKRERRGYPTQKPLALYERIIKASSKDDDMVLDPFCGCATTPVAAERLGRQWVGMDIWDKAHQQVLDRLEDEGVLLKGRRRRNQQQMLIRSDITYSTTPPKRTDEGETATLVLRTPTDKAMRYPPPRTQHFKLLSDMGPFCQGCGADYGFDTRVLEVDHINPRSQGGTDAYDNLTLLCPPCNKEKRDRYTLVGLQQANRSAGYMKNENNLRMGRVNGRRSRRRRA